MIAVTTSLIFLLPIFPIQATEYPYSFSFGSLGNSNGNFDQPYDISINDTGFIFVADTNNNRIQIFDSSGNWKQSFGSLGSGNGQFQYPAGISVNSTGFIFVADPYNNRIQVFDSSGNWKQSFNTFDTSLNKFRLPYGIAVNNTGFIFVADTNNHQIKVFGMTNDTNLGLINSQGGILAYNNLKNSSSNNNYSVMSQVIFTESGLPTGVGFCWPFWDCVSKWGVTINGHTNNASTNTISFSLTSSTYPYTIVPPNGYSASPSSGGLLVEGKTNQDITFQKNNLQ